MSTVLSLDFDDLTIQEVVDFEEVSGVSIEDVAGKELPFKAVLALVWITKRREDPSFTIEQAGREKVRDIEFVQPEGGSNPTEAERRSSESSLASSTSFPR